MEGVGATLADLVEHEAANTVLGREGGRTDLNFLHSLQHHHIGVCAGWQRHRSAVRKNCAERQVSIDGGNLLRIC